MKSQDSSKKSAGAQEAAVSAPFEEETAEVIDFSKVQIEPLFKDYVDFETFSKSDFRAVKVKDCVAVKKSKKLLQFTLDDGTGEDRTILSGIHAYYEPEELIGKKVVLVCNLKPAKLCGVESNGMILASGSGDDDVRVIFLDPETEPGAGIH